MKEDNNSRDNQAEISVILFLVVAFLFLLPFFSPMEEHPIIMFIYIFLVWLLAIFFM